MGVGYRWIDEGLRALVPSARREDHGMGMLVLMLFFCGLSPFVRAVLFEDTVCD